MKTHHSDLDKSINDIKSLLKEIDNKNLMQPMDIRLNVVVLLPKTKIKGTQM